MKKEPPGAIGSLFASVQPAKVPVSKLPLVRISAAPAGRAGVRVAARRPAPPVVRGAAPPAPHRGGKAGGRVANPAAHRGRSAAGRVGKPAAYGVVVVAGCADKPAAHRGEGTGDRVE